MPPHKLASRSLSKSFGDLEVLRDISVGVDDGEFVGLVGPSGCGKTTFLRIVCGLEPADSGTISVDGRNTKLGSPHDAVRHGIGYCPEDRKK